MVDIGSKVKNLRLAKKIKAIELARMANISQPYLSDIENGRTKPSLDTLESICKALGITLSEFFAEETTSAQLNFHGLNVAKRLTELRESMNMSKNQLAKLSGVSQSYISDIELEKKNPSLDILERLCNALGITVVQFLQDANENDMPPDLLQLLENAKKLPPAERKALNEYLKVRLSYIDETSAAESVILEQEEKYAGDKVASIPLVGASAAGTPMTAIGYYEGNFEVPEDWGDFAVRVHGDSMEPLIPNGGFAFIRQQEEVNNGEIALVKTLGEYEDEATIKRIRFMNGKVQLISENPAYEPMIYDIDKVKILGKVKKWLTAEEGCEYLKEYV